MEEEAEEEARKRAARVLGPHPMKNSIKIMPPVGGKVHTVVGGSSSELIQKRTSALGYNSNNVTVNIESQQKSGEVVECQDNVPSKELSKDLAGATGIDDVIKKATGRPHSDVHSDAKSNSDPDYDSNPNSKHN